MGEGRSYVLCALFIFGFPPPVACFGAEEQQTSNTSSGGRNGG